MVFRALLAAGFPRTFFADPKQVQPLKINIHQDLFAALPGGAEQRQAGRFLWWYINRPAWTVALAETMGERTAQGFMLANPGLQVFERQPKAPAEVASPLAEALSAALAAANPAEVAPVPVVPAVNPTTADPAGQRSKLSLKKRNLPC